VPIAPGQQPGNIRVADVNGDGVINTKDYTIVGNNNPNILFGINNRVSYKNIGLNILLVGQLGGKLWNIGYRYYDNGSALFNSFKHWTHSFRPPSPNGENPFPKNPVLAKVDRSFNGHIHENW